MIKKRYLIQAWLVALMLCSGVVTTFIKFEDHAKETHDFIQQVKNKPHHPIDPIPELKPLEQFTYPETSVRPSPFQLKKSQTFSAIRPNAHQRDPLEDYPLDALKFTGVIEEKMKQWALIRLPDGRIARIKLGEYMGQNEGKVVAVTENSLIIEEQINDQGKWVKRRIMLRLNDVLNSELSQPSQPPSSERIEANLPAVIGKSPIAAEPSLDSRK